MIVLVLPPANAHEGRKDGISTTEEHSPAECSIQKFQKMSAAATSPNAGYSSWLKLLLMCKML